jgi:hypothetical protein
VLQPAIIGGEEKLIHEQSAGQVICLLFLSSTFQGAISVSKTFCLSFIWA